jgi:hypothetical protein
MAALVSDENENVWVAASDGDIEKVQKYIQDDPRMATSGDENGYTAIHAAAAYGHQQLIQILLEAGADLHARDSDGDTPLHHCDDPATAAFLVSLGASPTISNNEGKTPPQVHLEDEEEAMVAYWRSVGALDAGPIITMVTGDVDFEGQGQLPCFDEGDENEEAGPTAIADGASGNGMADEGAQP